MEVMKEKDNDGTKEQMRERKKNDSDGEVLSVNINR
jgi:hypothetical protein